MRRAIVWLALVCTLAPLAPAATAASAASLDLLGNFDPGSPGFNASAVGLDGIAYLGSWGGAGQCPSLGVRVIDIHDPANAQQVSTAAAYTGTTAEHLAAVSVTNPTFVGNVLFAGIQRCVAGGGAPSGLAIWDVTDPANPAELSFFSTGRNGRGVHEFTVRQRGDRWYAFLAVSNSEATGGPGDLRIVDVTNPRNPVAVADWGARRDAGLPIGSGEQCAPTCRGSTPQSFLHSVALSPNGRIAYLSYWDLGVIVLDVSEPSTPTWLGHFSEPTAAEGNTHSVSVAHGGSLALIADETGAPPWGRLRLVDVQDPSNPIQVGVFDTANGEAGTPGEQYAYSIHNPLADDRDPNRAYLAWYADGVRVLDVTDGAHPVEVNAWLPPREPFVWNVAFLGNLLLVGDVNHGLYVLER
ncbi:MAG TPA: hypothetical protein VFG86_25955 [Chloroflexota bacterium]|jgi:hypothetical protein|nr:hypothetical protein [Chloroflexota bacterium]